MATLQLRPTLKQHQAYQELLLPEVDTLLFGGGAGGGKTWWLCEDALKDAHVYPGSKSFIGREELKRLMGSTFLTWSKVCAFHGIPKDSWHLNGQYNFIEFVDGPAKGSRVDLLDLKFLPSDPLYERFGSMEFGRGRIEEGGEVDFRAYDVLKSRIGRHNDGFYSDGTTWHMKPYMAITGNPKKNWMYQLFYKPWKEGTLPYNMRFVQSLYNDNPFTAVEYEKQLQNITDPSLKQRLMLGNWEYDDDPAALIRYDAITDLWTNTIEQSNKSYNDKYLTADIARYGQDKTVLMLWRGLECYRVLVYTKQGLDQTAQVIKDLARTEEIPYSHIIVDEDGVGGGVVDILRGIKGFVANTAALAADTSKPDNFANLKTQCYYVLADYVNTHRIAVRTEDTEIRKHLTEELEQVKSKDIDADRKRQLVPKDEVREILGRSPDYSDTLMMRMYFELKPATQGMTASTFVPKVGSPTQIATGARMVTGIPQDPVSTPRTAHQHVPSWKR